MISELGGNLIFLIGPPRSGTTLMSLILSNAPPVYCPPERWAALGVEALVCGPRTAVAHNSDERLTHLALCQTLSAEQRIGLARDVLFRLYGWWLSRDGRASMLVDKTPRYYRIVDFLASALPEARFVLMARSPLDVAGSHKLRWGTDIERLAAGRPEDGLDPAAADVFFSHGHIADARDRLGGRAYFLRYEDLVSDPAASVIGCFDFLGIPYSEDVLIIDRTDRRYEEHRRSVLGDKQTWEREGIDASSVGTFRERLTEDEIALVGGVVGPGVLEQLGYEPLDTIDLSSLRERLRSRLSLPVPCGDASPPRRRRGALPLISIVTPSYNQGRWIENNIVSILEQDYPRFEHFVIDGGSTDETLDVVRRYPHVHLVTEPDRGQSHAINKGLLLTAGDIVAYLNSDDIYYPHAFRAVAERLSEPSAAPILTGGCNRIDESGAVLGHYVARGASYDRLQRYWGWDISYCLPQQSTFWRREVISHVGLFDAGCDYSMDYDMWMRMLSHYTVQTIEQTLSGFRFHPESKTVAQADRMCREHLRVARRYWPAWHAPTRWRLETRGHLVTATGLLDVAEHVALGDDPRSPLRLLGQAIAHCPLLLFNPRFALTAVTAQCARSSLDGAARHLHRTYLHAGWHAKRWLRRRRMSRPLR